MIAFRTVCMLGALLCFGLAAVNVKCPINLVALGLFLTTMAVVVA